MAFPTSVNSQVTDAVTQANVQVLGDAPAMALATLYQTVAHAITLSMQNAVSNQQQAAILSNAVVTQCVTEILGSEQAR